MSFVTLLIFSIGFFAHDVATEQPYYGAKIGSFTSYAHEIKGDVYAVDEDTIFIKGFSYDGTGPDAFFWFGNPSSREQPSPQGTLLPYPEDHRGPDPPVLGRFVDEDILLNLPRNHKVTEIGWLSVWCRRFTVNFGDVFIPSGLVPPRPRVLPEFRRLAHGLRSGNITILDTKTFYIPNLHYDGAGPDAYFWVGRGDRPSTNGIKVANERKSFDVLKGYVGEDIEIQLPGDLTVYDIDWLSVWCVEFRQNFGHVLIPRDLSNIPPALGQTKITPTTTPRNTGVDFSNCKEFLGGKMQVRWRVVGDSVYLQMSAQMDADKWMAFGLSGAQGRSEMIGGDVIVAFYNAEEGNFQASDYYMSAKSQCANGRGVCPDSRTGGSDDAIVIYGDREDGITTITVKRPLSTNDRYDADIPRYGEVNVIAAIGNLNGRREANYHQIGVTRRDEDIRVDFSSNNKDECKSTLKPAPPARVEPTPWPIAKIAGQSSFTARIGPTGGRRGYTPITGMPSWGIAWWINDRLIPEIYVERGNTYMFTVEGGNNPRNPARYHPFYITSSPEGGYSGRTPAERRQETVYAGVETYPNGTAYPTAAGRLCEWHHRTVDMSGESETFEEYFRTLQLECSPGEPVDLVWTVDSETPDLVYYQCYTHRNLGWKIHVVDQGTKIDTNTIERPSGSTRGGTQGTQRSMSGFDDLSGSQNTLTGGEGGASVAMATIMTIVFGVVATVVVS